MPKIRDLGINVIPATMRPPEIGDGGAGGGCHPSPPQCHPTPADGACCPTDHESNRDKDKDEDDEKGDGGENITPDQRRELQQQLRDQINLQL